MMDYHVDFKELLFSPWSGCNSWTRQFPDYHLNLEILLEVINHLFIFSFRYVFHINRSDFNHLGIQLT